MKRLLSSIRPVVLVLTVLVLISGSAWGVTTGKIAGVVMDEATGEPLAGADVFIRGTRFGAATDVNGQYFILLVPPGVYTVRASMIGYRTMIQRDARVMINLTTTIDFQAQVEAIVGEEVTVTAERPVVQPDISANIANVTAEEIEFVPVAGISEFINLQAGIEPGMRIRGAGTDNLSFVVERMIPSAVAYIGFPG